MNIEQSQINDLIFYVEPSSAALNFLFCAQNRCESCEESVKYFNASQLTADDCLLTFSIEEVGDGGVEDLDNGKVRLTPPGSWDLSLYEVVGAAEKDPTAGTLLTTQKLNVVWDSDCNIF